MMQPFQIRLLVFVGVPARKDFRPPGREERFVWTRQQALAGCRRHLPQAWLHRNGERTAYAVNMHLAMRREAARG